MMIRKYATLGMAALALSLSACGGESTELPKSDALEKVAAPAGKAWTDVVVKTENGYKMGNPDAKVQLLEFGAISCPGCAKFSVTSTAELHEMVNGGTMSFEFRPFLVHGIQDIPGFLLAQCNGPEAFFGLTEQLYAGQSEWLGRIQTMTEADQQKFATLPPIQQIQFLGDKMGLVEFVKSRGVAQDAAKMCLADQKAFEALVAGTEKASKEDNISGTPTLKLNGALLNPAEWPSIKIALKNAGVR